MSIFSHLKHLFTKDSVIVQQAIDKVEKDFQTVIKALTDRLDALEGKVAPEPAPVVTAEPDPNSSASVVDPSTLGTSVS